MNDAVEARTPKLPPSYPPKSPPPQKKPVEAPRPQPPTKPKSAVERERERPRLAVRNRRTAALTHRSDEWAAKKAAGQALATVRGWGYGRVEAADLDAVVRHLVNAAVADGGRRVSVHLADQEQRVLVLVLSHRTETDPAEDGLLGELAAVRTVVSCGTDSGPDGRRLWALLDTDPRPRRTGRAVA
jgi:hypothetical protein